MPREIIFRGYDDKNEGLTCAFCGLPFKIGDRIVKTSTKRYHKSCYEKLLH